MRRDGYQQVAGVADTVLLVAAGLSIRMK